MPETEEKNIVREQLSSSVAEVPNSSLEDIGLSGDSGEMFSDQLAVEDEGETSAVAPQKIALKKQTAVPSKPHPEAALEISPETISPPIEQPVSISGPEMPIDVEVDLVLDRKRIPLTELSALAPGEIIALGGTDFKVMLFLQDKAIGEGELVLVDQKPAIQITKVFNHS